MNRNTSEEQPLSPARPNREQQWIVVATGGQEYILNNSLVLSAIGIEHRVDLSRGTLLVREADSGHALQELRAFARENRNWPPPPNYLRPQPRTDNPPTLLMIGGLIVFYMVTGPWFSGNPWFAAGAIDSKAILEQGQWWRLVTALTLHADQMHLVGNCVIGAFMVHLLCRTSGFGTGWLALILSGLAGNWLNIVLRKGPHFSVGFSTAIFAAIGIFCGQQLIQQRPSLIRQIILPLGAGAGLLAMLGTEGKHTDLGAHLFGFGCGIVCGLLVQFSNLDLQADNRSLQQLLFTLTLILIGGSWLLAAHFM
jgi:membrane associated rhomboid family serine protease